MSAASTLFPWGLCSCYGRLAPADGESLVCEQCGEVRSITPPEPLPIETRDPFDMPPEELSAKPIPGCQYCGNQRETHYRRCCAEGEHEDRMRDVIAASRFAAREQMSEHKEAPYNDDIQPFTRTTKY